MKATARLLLLALCGFGAGIVNGLLGAGSGVLIVFALHAVLGKQLADSRDVFANATAVILPISLFSALSYLRAGALPAVTSLSAYLLPGAAGGVCGALLMNRLSGVAVKRIFGAVVLLSGLIMLVR